MNKTGSDSVLLTNSVKCRNPFPIFSTSQIKEINEKIKDLVKAINPSLEQQHELLQLKYRFLGHCFEVDKKSLNLHKYQLSLCEEKLGQEQSCHKQMVKALKAEIQELKSQNEEKLNEWKQKVDEFKKEQEKLNALLAIQNCKDLSLNESTMKLKEENEQLKNSLKRTREMLETSIYDSFDWKVKLEEAERSKQLLAEKLELQEPKLKRLKEETDVKDMEIVSLRRKLNLAQNEIQKLQNEREEQDDVIEFL